MPYTVIYNPTTRMLESIVRGDVTLGVLRDLFTEQARVSMESRCQLMLNDYREATIKLSTLDIYSLPRLIAEIAAAFGMDVHQARRALVIAKDSEDYYFYETVTANQAQTEKVFFDIEKARLWLLGQPI
jgi:hypothetical protein